MTDSQLLPLIIHVPVECHNGHKATAIIEIRGTEPKYKGVPPEQDCSCSKWELNQGWKAVGSPYAQPSDVGATLSAPLDVEALKREMFAYFHSTLKFYDPNMLVKTTDLIDYLHRTNRLKTTPHKENDDG